MTIELYLNGKPRKAWILDYTFGFSPTNGVQMELKELDLALKVMECKVDAGPLIYGNCYEMFAVIRSSLNTEKISADEYAGFLNMVRKNEIKRSGAFNIQRKNLLHPKIIS
ncbi:MAG: hypothetical protein ABI760_25430 [Ferruginibacter sp.]